MNKFWIITSDVYKKNVKSISFLIMILVPFIMVGVVYLAGTFAGNMSEVDKIGLVSNQPELAEALAKDKTGDYKFTVVNSEDSAQKQLKDEKIDAYMVLTIDGENVKGELFSESSMGQSTELILQQTLASLQSSGRAAQLGLNAEEVASLSQPAEFVKQKVSFDEDGKMQVGEDNSALQFIVSYVATILLFVIILTYAQIIAQEIASEKGTRIMEVILSSTKAQTHFYGKLTGVLLVAVTQIVLYAAVFGASYMKFKDLEIVKQFTESGSLQKIIGPFLGYTVIFIILGILIYSVLAALCGSLVNKAEDTAKAILPVTYLSLGAYMLGLTLGAADPNNIVIRVTSYIPFLSSYVMPIRLANETVGMGGAAISVVVLLISTFILMFLSAALYKSNVLVYSEGGLISSLKQSISIMRNEKKK
ncbi:ABC transporter permease [Enterococcus phoeniculicola]|jgi:ABC-2 type transport system permease protein|uniref:ABC transporter membrane-spanning permease n=1 Tax=Enterococcus phoeniculicola ATCC BAA-412 TaxID=1158610 RepID=R3TMG0_9ENTE|nr:ABC transporter permease [Enterococcus phoeniculicola]EOL42228.1 ABC transporter membrane-spanning permease [Enterococcus phoeniculicola ATCC BAA-412]EOT79493.1 ABC transporter membrane-spanning permease [Enterococcus phoeniculicola ATCC BAA-412]